MPSLSRGSWWLIMLQRRFGSDFTENLSQRADAGREEVAIDPRLSAEAPFREGGVFACLVR